MITIKRYNDIALKGDFMFIDDKIKEYIEHEKEGWQASKEIWEKIKDELKRNKELYNYLSTYANDSIH